MPQLIIASTDIVQDTITAGEPVYRHIRSLRIRPGESVILLDEHQNRYTARLEGFRGHSAVLKIIDRTPVTDGLSGILLAQAALKNENMNTVLQKATELGVDGILPFISRYTSVRIDKDRFLARSRRIIREAVGQCMRSRIPDLYSPALFSELILSRTSVPTIVFHNAPDIPPLHTAADLVRKADSLLLVIGPEGGFSDDEITFARQHNAVIARLGDTILRAETAAIASLSVVSFLRNQDRRPHLL